MAFRRVLVDRYNWQTIAGNGARTFYSARKGAVVDFPAGEATRGDNLGALEAHAGPAAGEVLTLVGPADPTLSVVGDATAAGDTLGELETMVATRSAAAEAAATSDLNAHVDAQPGTPGAHTRFESLIARAWGTANGFTTAAVGTWEYITGSEVRVATDFDAVSLNGRTVRVEVLAMAAALTQAGTVADSERRIRYGLSFDDGATWTYPVGTIGAGYNPQTSGETTGAVTTAIRVRLEARQHAGLVGDILFSYLKLIAKVWE